MSLTRREFGQTLAAAAVLLQLAYAFEQATRHLQRRPAL